MNFNTLTLNLNYAGQTQPFDLRLSVGSQLKLKRETGDEGIQLIFNAMSDLSLTLKIFTEALNFKDNQNAIKDGSEFYEVLVDNGYLGKEAFAKLLFDIASCSGIIKPEQAEKLSEMIDNTYDRLFNSLEDFVNEPEPEDDKNAGVSFRPNENTDA